MAWSSSEVHTSGSVELCRCVLVAEWTTAGGHALADALEQPSLTDACPFKAVPGELGLAAIVGAKEEVAIGERVEAPLPEVGETKRVALGLRDLRFPQVDELVVQPVRHPRPAEVGLALRDLVRVVDWDVVDAAGVHVEAFAEVLHAHHRALEMPTGRALSPG